MTNLGFFSGAIGKKTWFSSTLIICQFVFVLKKFVRAPANQSNKYLLKHTLSVVLSFYPK